MSERIACDVVVLGLGPGGQELATELAEAGLDTVGVEMHLVGGECPFYGCTPSKLMIRAADHVAMVHRADHLAGPATVEPDWSRPAARITDEATKGWTDDANAKAVQEAGVRLVRGHGRLVAPGVVEVEGVEYEASRGVVLNTGTEPLVLPIDGLADTPYWTNRDVVQVTELPRSLVVLGGGPIGCELAQAIARFGVAVTVIEADDRLLAVEEPESSALITRLFEDEGITVHTGVQIDRVEHDGTFVLTAGDLRVEAERLLVAAGRSNNLRDVGLEPSASTRTPRPSRPTSGCGPATSCGPSATSPGTAASPTCRATRPRWPWPTSSARTDRVADYRAVSRVTFTDPEIGSVGLTEEQAREQGLDVRTGFADISGSARGWLDGAGQRGPHQARRRRRQRGCWWAPPRWVPPGETWSRSWRWPSTPRCRRPSYAGCTSPSRPTTGSVMTALDDLGL